VAIDAESRLVLAVIPGERTSENAKEVVREVKARTGDRPSLLLTSDEYAPYATAIEAVYAEQRPAPRKPGPGRPPKPLRVMPSGLCYATVCKRREKGKVVEVKRKLVFGTPLLLGALLLLSSVSLTVNTSIVERHNGTDRRQNGRKHRKTYGFSKERDAHDAVTFFVTYSYNFCWPVATLSVKNAAGKKIRRTPAMAAALADRVWSLKDWLSRPANPCLLS